MKSRPKYQWPANRITPEDMAILYRLRERTGLPVNQLLKEAIDKFGKVMRSSSGDQDPAISHGGEEENPTTRSD